MSDPRKFAPTGPLALEPRAFGMLLLMPYQPVTIERDGVTVISVRGPLSQFADPFCESYESILARVEAAVSKPPRALVLSIASPGGVVAGCFEAAARIRSICARAGVPLVSYVDGAACSAAYALACAASHIAASPTASVGSIGVIAEVIDASARNAQQGIAVRMLASGSHKTDGQPAVQVNGPALQSMQSIVDRLAGEFFAFVGAARGVNADAVRALDAQVFIGSDAQSLGLTDSTQTLDELLAGIGSLTTVAGREAPPQAAVAAKGTIMSKAYDEAIAALRKAAESDDPKESAKAKRMLKAELAEDDAPPAAEPDGDEQEGAECDPPAPPKDEEDKPSARAPGVGASIAQSLASTVQAMGARLQALEAERESTERASIIASRPDLNAELVKVLASSPVADVKRIINALPKPTTPKPAATVVVPATRGEGQGVPSPTANSETSAMDRVMGFAARETPIRITEHAVTFGVMSRDQAAEHVAKATKGDAR